MKCIKKMCMYGLISFGMFIMSFSHTKCVKAESGFDVVQRSSKDDKSIIYAVGVKEIDSKIQCQIGKDYINDASMAYCENSDRMSQTLILFDNSASVPKNRRKEFDKIVRGLILNKMPNERMCLATFNSKIGYLSDYTDDKNLLYKALGKIKFKTQSTYLTDVLYNIIKTYNSSKVSALKRIIVLSDGFDNKRFGITKTELMNQLKETPYYIATIGCENGDNDKDLKNMFAVSRIANAKNYLLDDKSCSVKKIVKGLSLEKTFAKISIDVPKALRDGSKKSVRIKLEKNNQFLTTDIKMPFPAKENSDNKGFLSPLMKNIILVVCACVGIFLIIFYIIMKRSKDNIFSRTDVYSLIAQEYKKGHTNTNPNPMLRIVEDYDKTIDNNDLLCIEKKGTIEKI